MLSGFIFGDIIINIFRNKAVHSHAELVDSYKKNKEKSFICIEGHIKILIGRMVLMKILMLYIHIPIYKNDTIFFQ